jgi:hypothetical protein
MSDDRDRDLEELYAVAPTEFTRVRNAKAAALKAAGHVAEAQAVQRLSKPSVPLWAANQLARLAPRQVARFIDAVQEVQRRQLRDPRAAAEAMQTQRGELAALTDRAAAILIKAGYRASSATLERVSTTLLGAAVDRRQAADLRRGRLAAELAAPGFEVLAGAPKGLQVLRGGRESKRDPAQAAAREARRQDERERRARDAEAERRAAEAERREATQRAEAARRAEDEVRELERRLAEARARRRAAQRDASTAATRLKRRDGPARPL